jgi:hypothetical protein
MGGHTTTTPSFVKGHDFSRAATAAKSTRALEVAEKLAAALAL